MVFTPTLAKRADRNSLPEPQNPTTAGITKPILPFFINPLDFRPEPVEDRSPKSWPLNRSVHTFKLTSERAITWVYGAFFVGPIFDGLMGNQTGLWLPGAAILAFLVSRFLLRD